VAGKERLAVKCGLGRSFYEGDANVGRDSIDGAEHGDVFCSEPGGDERAGASDSKQRDDRQRLSGDRPPRRTA